jgi:PST family polysaccharide transporter
MSQLFNNVRWASVSQISKIVAQLISMVVLARLLNASDYGIIAMAYVVTALAGMLREMGTGTAIIQKKELSEPTTSTIFWLNVGLGCMIGLLLIVTSPLISRFFREPQLAGVLISLAILFPITGATTVHQALIERRSEFKTLSLMDITTQSIGLCLAIAFALNGAGVYSFVVPAISTAIITSIWLWNKSHWRPKFIWSQNDFKSLLGFTGNLTGFNFINYFARNADGLIIGKVMGAVSLGTYSLAYRLMLFPVQNLTWVVSRVMLPTLSRLQTEPLQAKLLYLKSLQGILTITAPLMIGLWALREPFVMVVFGEKWKDIIPLLAWLAPVGLLQSMNSTTGTVFTAFGRTDLLFKFGLISTIVTVMGFVIGAQHGLIVLAMIYFITNIFSIFLNGLAASKVISANFQDLKNATKPSLISAICMGASVWIFIYYASPFLSSLNELVLGCLIGVIVYFVTLTFIFKQSIVQMFRLIKA